jgi:hypothetical protein
MGLPVWEDAEADWDPAEAPDWDPRELADWEPDDPDGEQPGWAASARTGGDGGWFSSGGIADDLLPGPRLAGFIADAEAIGLGRLTDDELIGLMQAARRLASWSAAMELAATGDLWRRRWAEEQAGNSGAARHTDDEIAAALTLTRRGADQVLSLAVALRRLPLTSRALTAGDIDLPRAMVIADEVTGLGNEHAAAVEQAVIGAAAGQTTGQLRAAARRAALSADPRAARKRKEQALQDARVERWEEHGGTAALAGRDLPPASVLAADKNLSALARQLKRAGAPGTLDQLRAQVYLALLTGSPVSSLVPANPGTASGMSPGGSPRDFTGLAGDPAAPTTAPGSCPPARPTAFGGPGTPASPDAPGALYASGTVNLTMPLASWLGLSDAPGNVAGFGPLDADDSRAIANALSARADTKWCLTLTDSRGRPVAHGCARAGPPRSQRRLKQATGPPGAHDSGSRDEAASSPRDRPPGSLPDRRPASVHDRPADGPRDGPRTGAPNEHEARTPGKTWIFRLTLLTGGDCDHAWETTAYRPSPGLRHLVETRDATCTYPGCRQPATHCDADHTTAYHREGRTCLCNLAPLCRRHHRAKQAPGWHLSQDQPGVLTWRLPSGRIYATCAEPYPV